MAEYIEKEQILDALVASDDPWVSYLQPGIVTARAVVNSLPAADVAPVVHGRWVYGEDVDIQCSVCGADAFTEGDYRQVKSRYCPNCGAKMDLED